MSGETEADVSAWTIDSLRYHLEQIALDLDLRYQQRFEAQSEAIEAAFKAQDELRTLQAKLLDERYATQTKAVDAAFLAQQTAMQTALTAAERAVQTALLSAEKAVTKAEVAADKRFDSVNEFRAQLADQATRFLNRDEYRVSHEALIEKVDTGGARMAERVASLENRVNGMVERGAGAGEAKTGQRLDNGQLIAIGTALLAVAAIAVTLILGFNG